MFIQTVTPMECTKCGKDNWKFQTIETNFESETYILCKSCGHKKLYSILTKSSTGSGGYAETMNAYDFKDNKF